MNTQKTSVKHFSSSSKTMKAIKNSSTAKKKKFKIVQKPEEKDEKTFRLFDFQSFDHTVRNVSYRQKLFRIQMFGINEKGETCAIFVDDFKPFFYVKVPSHWNQSDVDEWFLEVKKKCRYTERDCLGAYLETHSQLYEFTANTQFHFAKCVFCHMGSFYQFRKHLSDPSYKGLVIYESKIPPLLRYFHIQNISPSGWISIHENDISRMIEEKTTTCNYEFSCRKCDVLPLPEKETPVPYKICSFDIEASSSHGDFPVPIKDYKRVSSQFIDELHSCMKKQKLQKEAVNLWLKKALLAIFSYGEMEGIDIVFPKDKDITKDYVKQMTKTFLAESLEELSKKEENCSILKISEMFESIAQKGKELSSGGGVEIDEADVYKSHDIELPNYVSKKTSYLKDKDKKRCISEYLLDMENTREEKINMLNTMLTTLFPPLEGDCVTFIGSTFLHYGEKEPYKNHCIVVGSCDDVPGSEIVSVKTESECLLEWTYLIQEENPDIIIGYNIFGFDYQFMFHRAKEMDIVDDFCAFSRIENEICYKRDKETDEVVLDHTQNRLASGDYDLHYPPISGRLQIDLLFYFRRDYNLSSYKLDDVAGTMIRDDIKGIQFDNQYTNLFSKNLSGLHENDFIHIEIATFTTDYYMDGKKFRILKITPKVEAKDLEGVPDGIYNVITIEGVHDTLNPKSMTLKWGMSKDDVSPQDIFRLSKESSASRAVVAKYCIQDCNLVHHLMNKVDVLTGYIEMARICSVPINFLVFRGQGIKLTSYVAKVCREKNTLMPDLEKTQNDDGYEGAIVLPPKCAIYGDNPVACVDYSSLYPSIAKGWNLSPNSKVWTKNYDLQGNLIKINDKKVTEKNRKQLEEEANRYDNLPDYKYINVTFDSFEIIQRYTAAGKLGRKDKVKCGTKVCRWAQFPNGQEGIIPCIIGDLLKARKETRVKAESEPDPFIANVLDKRQLGYKVTANSLYGQMGSSVSTFFEKDVAASITSIGRMMITYAKRMVEDIYGDSTYTSETNGEVRVTQTKSQYVYGDSVASYTPIYVRTRKTNIEILSIEDLAEKHGNALWNLSTEPGKQDKEYCELQEVECWTETGWTSLKRVIRHHLASHKQMLRVLTHTGIVDVTDDHSLVCAETKKEISPKDVKIGTRLLHHSLPMHNTTIPNDNITENEARIMGFFFGDGSCGLYSCSSGKKASWALNNASIILLEDYQRLCEDVYRSYSWKCLPTYDSSNVYKLVPSVKYVEGENTNAYGKIKEFVEIYRNEMYSGNAKIIPSRILSASEEVREAFFQGLYDADGDKDVNGYTRLDQKHQISASHICYLAQTLGWNTSINTRQDKPNIYRITMTKKTQRKDPCAIKKIHPIEYQGYVYDLTTENHHFAAGIGNMIVHNTDSVFFTFNLEDPKTGKPVRGKEALKWTIEIAQEAAYLCSLYLPPPMKLAYEKTLMSFILLSKKRYVGMLYEFNPDKGKLKFMGLPLKRRDACDYLKDVYGGILTILMKEPENVKGAIEFLNKSLQALVDGKVSMDKLALTKSLRSDYKNPDQIAHKVLAERIGEREPGNKPKPGDRIKYVFIDNKEGKLLGDRIETPQYIIHNGLRLDYHYYITNQLMNPLQQLFSLAIEKIYIHMGKKSSEIGKLHNLLDQMFEESDRDLEVFNKKREKYCSTEVKKYLFDPFLTKIYNTQNGIQTLMQYYKKA